MQRANKKIYPATNSPTESRWMGVISMWKDEQNSVVQQLKSNLMGLGWGNYLISVRRRRARLKPLSLESNCGQNALVNAATWRDSARVRVARGPALTRERPWGAVIVSKWADLLSHSPKQLEPRQLSRCPHLAGLDGAGTTLPAGIAGRP